jgi:hypothetical protein
VKRQACQVTDPEAGPGNPTWPGPSIGGQAPAVGIAPSPQHSPSAAVEPRRIPPTSHSRGAETEIITALDRL